jgi:hypothetical protein
MLNIVHVVNETDGFLHAELPEDCYMGTTEYSTVRVPTLL